MYDDLGEYTLKFLPNILFSLLHNNSTIITDFRMSQILFQHEFYHHRHNIILTEVYPQSLGLILVGFHLRSGFSVDFPMLVYMSLYPRDKVSSSLQFDRR